MESIMDEIDDVRFGINDKETQFAKSNRFIDRLGRLKQYFMRGHQFWFTLVLSMGSFGLLFYNFIVVEFTFIPAWINNFIVFFIVFSLSYFVVASSVGYLDYKRGTFYSQEKLLGDRSPIWQSAFKRMDRNCRKIGELKQEIDELKQLITELKK